MSTTAPALYGRRSELDALRRFVEAVPDGGAELVIEGEPGIGKTSLLGAGLTEAHARGLMVLGSRPAQADATVSFSGLDDLFHDVVDDVVPSLPEPQRVALEVA